jgi:hypothetical protein
MRNECLAAALRELDAVGIRDVEQAHGGKHPQLRWRGLRVYTLPGSPGDRRSLHNVRAEIRRMLKEDGVLTTPERSEPEPPRSPPKIDRLAELERQVAAQGALLAELKRRVAASEEFIRTIQIAGGDHGSQQTSDKQQEADAASIVRSSPGAIDRHHTD